MTLHTVTEHIFSDSQGMFTKIDHILDYNKNPNNFKKSYKYVLCLQ